MYIESSYQSTHVHLKVLIHMYKSCYYVHMYIKVPAILYTCTSKFLPHYKCTLKFLCTCTLMFLPHYTHKIPAILHQSSCHTKRTHCYMYMQFILQFDQEIHAFALLLRLTPITKQLSIPTIAIIIPVNYIQHA